MNDLKFAFRQLFKNPGFTAVTVLTLALGIGANTGIFSVINAVLLRPLPYREPEQIVMIWPDNPSLNLGLHELPPTPSDLLDWRAQAHSLEHIAGIRPRTADVSDQGDPERVGGVQVTANFLPLLGVEPMLGRGFTLDEEQPGNSKVAIISYGLWQRKFGGARDVIGSNITVNRERCMIVGVMPPGFAFPRGAEMPAAYGLLPQTEIWRPFAESGDYWRRDDSRDSLAIGRLKPNVRLPQAQAEMNAIAARAAKERPATHTGWTVQLRPLSLQVAGKTRPLLWMLLCAVAFILLIACANVANLLLCRSAARRKEIAVRAALGAGRSRIIRQLLTESIMLSLVGGGMGLVLGRWLIQLILAFSPPNVPRLDETTLDVHVLLFTLLLSIGTGIVFGLAPAWQAAGVSLVDVLKAGARSGIAPRQQRAQKWLVVAEVTLVVILLTGAALMVQSFLRLHAVDPGFQPHRVLAFDISLFGQKYEGEPRLRNFFHETRSRLSKLPAVLSVAAINNLPLGGAENMQFFFVEGAPLPTQGQGPLAENRRITPGYFETMGVKLVRGMDFDDHDISNQPRVCIINETLARAFFPGVDPMGKRLRLGGPGPEHPWVTVVGVARDVRGYALEMNPRPGFYVPFDQDTQNEMTLVVRAATDRATGTERALRAEMKALDPALPLANFRTMDTLLSNAVARPRFATFLLDLFAATALMLAMVGLYGVVAYAATQRTREIGIRLALGASQRSVLGLMLRQGMLPAVVGLMLGGMGALALTRLLASQLYGVKPTDPLSFAGAALTLLGVAMLASYLPARRATKVHPMEALRYE